MSRLLLVGPALFGLLVASGSALAADGTPFCTGPGCVGGNAMGGNAYVDGNGVGKGGFNQFWNRSCVDFYRNNSWPEPFLTADKMAIRLPYCIMTDNGWKMQNTVGSYLFDRDSQQINQVGELLVKWIVTQAPINRRAVFVLKGDTADDTNIRVQSVQRTLAKYGCVVPVLLTDCEPNGWPAAYIDTISQRYDATIPSPRLPPRQTNGSGNTGGAGQGGSGGGGVQ